jgi:organic anion transporter 5A
MFSWMVCLLVGWLGGCLDNGLLVDWLDGWMDGWLVGWLYGWLDG